MLAQLIYFACTFKFDSVLSKLSVKSVISSFEASMLSAVSLKDDAAEISQSDFNSINLFSF